MTTKLKIFLIFLIIIFIPSFLSAQIVGKIIEKKGRVDVFRNNSNFAVPVNIGDSVSVGDVFRAKSNSSATILFTNKNILKIYERTKVKMTRYMVSGNNSETQVDLSRGKVEAKTSKKLIKKIGYLIEKNKFEVHTPTAIAGIKGTDFIVFHFGSITGVLFLEGHGYVYNPKLPDRVIPMKAGQITFLSNPGEPPAPPRKASKKEIQTLIKAKEEIKTKTKGKITKKTPITLTSEKASVISGLTAAAEIQKNIVKPKENIKQVTPVEVVYKETTKRTSPKTSKDSTYIPITEIPKVKEKIENTPPTIDEPFIYTNFIPVNNKISIKASDENNNLEAVFINNKKMTKKEDNIFEYENLEDLRLKEGLNEKINVKAIDSKGSSDEKFFPLFYSKDKPFILNGLNSSYLSIYKENGAVSLTFDTENFPQYVGGTIAKNNEQTGYWLKEANNILFITNSSYGKTSKPVINKNKYLFNQLLNVDSNIENPSFELKDYNFSDKKFNSKIKGLMHITPTDSIVTLGELTNTDDSYFIATIYEDSYIDIDTIKGKLGVIKFKDKIYAKFLGYSIKKLSGENYKIETFSNKLKGNYYSNINLFKLSSDEPLKTESYINFNNSKLFNNTLISVDSDVKIRVDYNNFENLNKGLAFGEFEIGYDENMDLSKTEYSVANKIEINDSNNLFFTANISVKDKDDSFYLGEISNGIVLTKTKIAKNLDGYVLRDLSNKLLKGWVSGKWEHLTYSSLINKENFSGILGSSSTLLGDENYKSKYILLANFIEKENIPSYFEIQSYNSELYKKITFQQDAFDGFIAITSKNNKIAGSSIALFTNKDGHTGILKENNLTGELISDFNMIKMEGEWEHIYIENFDEISPDEFVNNIGKYYSNDYITMEHVKNAKWGIFTEKITTSSTEDNIIIGDYNSNDAINAGEVTKNVYSYGAKLNEGTEVFPETWISISDIIGTTQIDTFNAIAVGAWIETERFLAMVENIKNNPTNADKTILEKLKIPFVQVGETNLEGEGNNLIVQMNKVAFFATQEGAKPKIWATKDIKGNYYDTPIVNTPVNLSNSNKSLTANFTIKKWQNHRWIAAISGEGELKGGSYTGNIQFKGAAAGTYLDTVPTNDTNFPPPGSGDFKGTAAGIVKE